MIILHLKRIIFIIYFSIYTIFCSKFLNIPFIKNKNTIFFNEWLNLTPLVCDKILNTNIYYSGNFIESDNNVDVMICNHLNRLDCFIIASTIKKYSNKNIYTIIQKDISKIPFISSFCQDLLVINRDYSKDRDLIISFVKKLNNCILVILPEGSRMNKKNMEISHEFCERNNLKKYNNILYPKMKGLDLIINELNNNNKLGNLIDLTIKIHYKLKFKINTLDYLRFNMGNTYCNINTYKINDKCFNNYDNFKKWFLIVWDKKEDFLNNYKIYEYELKKFRIKSSTYILNLVIFNCILFKLNSRNIFSLGKKKNIVIN